MSSRSRLLLVLAASVFFVPLLHAQSNITCESKGRRRAYCQADTRGGVELVRQLSHEECVRGRNWGVDSGGIWVQEGCRAEFRLERYNGGPWWWNSGEGRAPNRFRGAGACFYRDRDFAGDYFCMRRGESFNRMPPGFDDQISSIRVFGGAEVFIFADDDFRGMHARSRRDIGNLKNWSSREDPGRTWNDRISSLRVD